MDDLELPVPPPLRYRTHEPVLTSTWTRVDQFSTNRSVAEQGIEDDEWEEEEVEYVTLDFGPHLPEETFTEATSFQLLAAESSTPYIRIGNKYFQGQHETSIGTEILLRPLGNHGSSEGRTGTRPGGEETNVKQDGEKALEVFATTGSHRIVLHPVTIDYAKKLPELLAAQGTMPIPGGTRNNDIEQTISPGETRSQGSGRGKARGKAKGRQSASIGVLDSSEAVEDEDGRSSTTGIPGCEDVEMQE